MEPVLKCVLRCLDSACNDVTLWTSDPLIIGRSRDTRIKDKRCSKQQVQLSCQLSEFLVRVHQLGSNPSAVNGVRLRPSSPSTARHGDVIEVLEGTYKYRVEFDPPPPSTSSPDSAGNKRLQSSSSKDDVSSSHSELRTSDKSKRDTDISNNLISGDESPLLSSINSSSSIKLKADSWDNSNILKENTKGKSEKNSLTNDVKTSIAKGKVGAVSSLPVAASRAQFRDGNIKNLFTMPPKGRAAPQKRGASEAAESKVAKKAKMEGVGVWTSLEKGDLLVYNMKSGGSGSEKVAAFDMDGTLIVTQSGRVFATNYDDWKIIFSEVPGKLKQLREEGYKIILFTNQAGIAAGKQTVAGIQGKITAILSKLGFADAQAFISTGRGKFRKPAPYMWEYMEQHCNGGVTVDRSRSIYVGDAAGRPEVPKQRKKDFSSADRLFALNLAVPFKTPEELFLGRKTEPFKMPEFDPRSLSSNAPQFDPASTIVPLQPPELVVMVGFPGSGKSVLATSVLAAKGYRHANRDTLGTWQKCAAAVQSALQAGQSVVVDNTNPDRESRSRYIKIATDLKRPARCFVMDICKAHARHNNKFRELTDPSHSKVSDMIFNMYKSKFQPPALSEGYVDIVKVNFVPKFRDTKDEELYRMFLLEK